MFVAHLVVARSGLVPVAVTDSVSVPVAGSGLVSALRSVFNRTPERTPCRVLHRRHGGCQRYRLVLRQTLPGLGSLPLGLASAPGRR